MRVLLVMTVMAMELMLFLLISQEVMRWKMLDDATGSGGTNEIQSGHSLCRSGWNGIRIW